MKTILKIASLLIFISVLMFVFRGHSDTAQWRFTCDGKLPVLAISPDGALLAIGGKTPILKTGRHPLHTDGGTLELWDLKTRLLLKKVKVDGGVQSIMFTPDGTQVIASTANLDFDSIIIPNRTDPHEPPSFAGIVFWVVAVENPPEFIPLPGHVASLDISDDGSMLAAVTKHPDKNETQLWFADSKGQRLEEFDQIFESTESESIKPIGQLAFSNNKKIVLRLMRHYATGDIENKFEYWDLESKKRLSNMEWWGADAGMFNLVVSPDGKQVAARHLNIFLIADVDKLDEIQTHFSGIKLPRGMGTKASAFSQDSQSLAVGGEYDHSDRNGSKGIVKVWSFPFPDEAFAEFKLVERGSTIGSVVFTPDGAHLFTASYNGEINLWALPKENE